MANADGRTMLELSGVRVGYVPRDLANQFVDLISSACVSRIAAIYTGNILQLGPIRGGGPQLKCFYLLKCSDVDRCLALLGSQYEPSKLCNY